jgi:hypothetical protein
MQVYPAVVGPGEEASPQEAAGNPKIAFVFLHHHIGRRIRGSEQQVLALVDLETL